MARTAKDARAVVGAPASERPDDREDLGFRLSVDDLQPGANREVVLFNDSAFRDIVLDVGVRTYERGSVRSHVTAEGVDVSGFRFVRLDDGLTIYHAADTELAVVP